MIIEDHISFETAKLLKEKGFDECPLFRYDDCGELWVQGGYNKTIKWHFPAPTLQMAMKWLREEFDLIIYVKLVNDRDLCHDAWGFSIYNKFTNESIKGQRLLLKYEDACEVAIKYCLEHLI